MPVVTRLCPSAILVAAFLQLPTVCADEIYAFEVVLKPGESCEQLFKFPKGTYSYQAARISGNGNQLRIEAELSGVIHPARPMYRSPTNGVTFEVAQDGDIWKITCTNASTTETLSVTTRLARVDFASHCYFPAARGP